MIGIANVRRVQTGVANMNLFYVVGRRAILSQLQMAKAVAMIWRVGVAAVGTDWFGPSPVASLKGEW